MYIHIICIYIYILICIIQMLMDVPLWFQRASFLHVHPPAGALLECCSEDLCGGPGAGGSEGHWPLSAVAGAAGEILFEDGAQFELGPLAQATAARLKFRWSPSIKNVGIEPYAVDSAVILIYFVQ